MNTGGSGTRESSDEHWRPSYEETVMGTDDALLSAEQ